VNVATGPYAPLQARQVGSLRATGWSGGLLTWTQLPPGSPTHEDAPYGFKIFALREAERRGHTTILWLDAPCVATRPLDPLFDRTEREGHLFVTGGERLGHWASDECLGASGLTRDRAMELPLLNGTLIGLDLSNGRSREWLDLLQRSCERGLFRGPWLSDQAPAEVRARKPGKPVGFVSVDPRCWGHRHDEAVGSALAHRLGMAISPQAGIFDTEDAPVRSLPRGGPSTRPLPGS
jgi:hypothetical protein